MATQQGFYIHDRRTLPFDPAHSNPTPKRLSLPTFKAVRARTHNIPALLRLRMCSRTTDLDPPAAAAALVFVAVVTLVLRPAVLPGLVYGFEVAGVLEGLVLPDTEALDVVRVLRRLAGSSSMTGFLRALLRFAGGSSMAATVGEPYVWGRRHWRWLKRLERGEQVLARHLTRRWPLVLGERKRNAGWDADVT
ncbi:hypothetical protein M427DRAFT_32271 [Gonapodya prolifera JEL478]|uniref:Uncharacterized protein n=1 Tax=Gonapodya prolifera (strain JEL478) TaxID=1344416 RepID=A0A139AG95_GONPJ|nr:hypothetical protein M427DRAFT_32271 [Gonapodya prolifera JEL478]|eukprot:KXS15584.1 hypothetical protein M427DRAFT_32271 [Gonapodya prolifera JEL478]